MIARLWNGWTTPERADDYEQLLRTEVFPGIEARRVDGLVRMELLRRTAGSEIEFTTILWFESVDAVRSFAGEDYEQAYVPPAARAVLARFDERSRHYELVERRES